MLFQNIRLAYLQVMQDTPPTPVATAQAVQPIDESVPLEIVTAMAVGVGTLRCFSGETEIVTGEGTKPLRELAHLPEIKVIGKDGIWTPAQVKSFGIQRLWQLRVSRGSETEDIFTTAEHRWLFPDLTEATTVGLLPGQRLATVDGQEWRVMWAKPTQRVEEVFCAVVPEGQAFELGKAILTGNCTFYELWNEPVWAMLPGLEGTYNLLDVLKRQVTLGTISMQKIIKSPSGIMRARVFHNVVITDIDEGENINIGTMTLPKTLTFQYCYTTPV